MEKLKDKYITIYFEEHRKKRLDINEAKRRGKIQESSALATLRKLRGIEILSGEKLTAIEQDLSDLTVCYELTTSALKSNPICPHCRYNLGDKVKNVKGQLDNLEQRIDNLLTEWTNILIITISDPIVSGQKEYLSAEQQRIIDEFIESAELPKSVDDFFVNSIKTLLQGVDPVIINADEFMSQLIECGPLDAVTFKNKMNEIVDNYINGKDIEKLRIIVKRKDSEEP